jgi:hypothetical protein
LNKNLVIGAGVLALIGLIVNAAVDLDNVYDMTTTTLWLLTVILVFAGVFMGGRKAAAGGSGASAPATQALKCSACGMSFATQSELADHAKSAHPMPVK